MVTLTFVNQRFFRSATTQNLALCIASLLFYVAWDWRYLSLIYFSIFLDYFAARAIGATTEQWKKKTFLALSLAGNLGVLFFFKYFGFFVGEAIHLLNAIGLQPNAFTLELILPIGISFYTLQTMSYTIDVYRGDFKPEKNLLTYATYISFFPQLLAGPIERAEKMLPQFHSFNSITWSNAYQGLCLIIVGLFLKIVIADNLAPIVDEIFSDHKTKNGGVLVLGAIYFAVQIYGDFCGYSTIALGLAATLGVSLSTNFQTPFFSTTLSIFWRSWHITLFRFLKDYVYRSLGGPSHRARNIFLLFVISGLWHGANWTFICWGAFNALVIVASGWTDNNTTTGRDRSVASKYVSWLFTQTVFLIGAIMFRSPDLPVAASYLSAIASSPALPDSYRMGLQYVILLVVLDLVWRKDVRLSRGLVPQLSGGRMHYLVEAAILLILLNTIFVSGLSHAGETAFVYFQF